MMKSAQSKTDEWKNKWNEKMKINWISMKGHRCHLPLLWLYALIFLFWHIEDMMYIFQLLIEGNEKQKTKKKEESFKFISNEWVRVRGSEIKTAKRKMRKKNRIQLLCFSFFLSFSLPIQARRGKKGYAHDIHIRKKAKSEREKIKLESFCKVFILVYLCCISSCIEKGKLYYGRSECMPKNENFRPFYFLSPSIWNMHSCKDWKSIKSEIECMKEFENLT